MLGLKNLKLGIDFFFNDHINQLWVINQWVAILQTRIKTETLILITATTIIVKVTKTLVFLIHPPDVFSSFSCFCLSLPPLSIFFITVLLF